MRARIEPAAAFLVAAGVVATYALRGGTYDVVARGEAAVFIWWVLAVGFAAGLLPRARPGRAVGAVLAGFALLIAWTALAFGWTESDEGTSVELARVVHHAGVFVLAACLLSRRTVPAAIAGLATAAAVVCAVAVGSRLWPGSFATDVVQGSFGGNRLSYPFNYWNAVAAWGAMAAVLALAWSAHAGHAAWRAAALAAVPVCITATYLTYSRAGVVGVAVGVAVVFAAGRTRAVVVLHAVAAALASFLVVRTIRAHEPIAQATGGDGRESVLLALAGAAVLCAAVALTLSLLGADRRLRMARRPALISAGVGLVVAAAVAVAVLPPVMDDAWDEFTSKTSAAEAASADPAARLTQLNGNRGNLYRSALNAFEADPLNGTGPGTFEFWWNRDALNAEHVRDAHSLYLEALAETGWPGLLFVLVICGGAVAGLVAGRAGAAASDEIGAAVAALAGFAVWLFHAGVDWMWEETALTTLALLLAGAGCVLLARRAERPRLAVRIVMPVVCLVAVAVQLPPAVGTSRVRESQEAVRDNRPRDAAVAAADAISAWPWAASPYVQRALVSETSGDLPAAKADIERAIEREPTNWRHPLLLARLDARLGDAEAALRAFRRARELRPLSGLFPQG